MLNNKRRFLVCLAFLLILFTLTGCNRQDHEVPAVSFTAAPTGEEVAEPASVNLAAGSSDTNTEKDSSSSTKELTEQQKDSINMLNHLIVFTQEINAAKNSRLFLETAYSSVYNNINPNAVDKETQNQISYLLGQINEYRMTAIQRERLEYIYEQNRAQALRAALPSPLALMSAAHAHNLAGLLASVVYMAADAVTSYQSGISQADLQYLQDGWALDDEQAMTLHSMRTETFDYMVDTVRENNLPGSLALNEKSVAQFVEWKRYTNVHQKIQLFEDNQSTYAAFGPYWLTLAECYYANKDYAKCLDAISTYEELGNNIFRYDYEYARTLPLAIAAAEHILSASDYEATASCYIEAICKNTDHDEWALKYFAAQAYVDLYARTHRSSYLNEAYKLARSSVSHLLTKQLELNADYLAEFEKKSISKDDTKQQKKDIEQYNKLMEEERKTALPPVYEPLYLNCELLFALVDALAIQDDEIQHINSILHENGGPLFLSQPLDNAFRFYADGEINTASFEVHYTGTELILPAICLTDKSTITVTVAQGHENIVLTDWTLEKVERDKENNLEAFTAQYASQSAKELEYAADSKVTVEVTTMPGSPAAPLRFTFDAHPAKTLGIFESIEFSRVME